MNWLNQHLIQLSFSVGILLFLYILYRYGQSKIEHSADFSRLSVSTAHTASSTARYLAFVLGTLVLLIIWGIDVSSVLLFATTSLTVFAAAFFATWSILSNVTAYFILLLHPSFRRGNFIRVMDMDNYIEGYIADLTLFNTKLITESREVVVYPNNLLLAKPMVVNPRDRLNGIGKIDTGQAATEVATTTATTSQTKTN